MDRNTISMRYVYVVHWSFFALSVLCVTGGLILTWIGVTGQVEIEAFGTSLNTSVPGVAFAFIGYLIIKLTLNVNRKVVASLDAATYAAKELLATSVQTTQRAIGVTKSHSAAKSAIDRVLESDLPDYAEYKAAIDGKKLIDEEVRRRILELEAL